ncbi:hypothetical protein RI367_001045 [Sorochytrium milnesiophthora]
MNTPPTPRLASSSWFNAPLIYGIVLTFDLLALCQAASIIVKAKADRLPRYYIALLTIIVAHIFDVTLTMISWTPAAISGSGGTLIAPGYGGLNVVGTLFGWYDNAWFTVLNFVRLKPLLDQKHAWVKWILSVGVLISWLVCTGNNILYMFCYIENSSLASELLLANEIYPIWAIYDCAVNTVLSLAFLFVLKKRFPAGANMRPGIRELLKRARTLLIVECVAFIAMDAMVIAAPWLDPIQLLPYTVESLRLVLFTEFLVLLGRILNRKPGAHSTSGRISAQKPQVSVSLQQQQQQQQLGSKASMNKSGELRPQNSELLTSNAFLTPDSALER